MEEAFRRVPRAEIFERTGIQFMQLNSCRPEGAGKESAPRPPPTIRLRAIVPDSQIRSSVAAREAARGPRR